MSSLLVLKPKEAEFVSIVGDALIGKSEKIPFSFSELVLDTEVDRMLYHMRNPVAVNGVRLILKLVDFLPLFKYGKRFSQLDVDKRVEFLEEMEKSRWAWKRHILISLKSLIMLAYYHHPKVQRAINFEMKCR